MPLGRAMAHGPECPLDPQWIFDRVTAVLGSIQHFSGLEAYLNDVK